MEERRHKTLQGILVVGHGSKSPHASQVLEHIGDALAGEFPRVAVASMQFNSPTIEEAAAQLIEDGVRDIVVAPFFLYSGNHVLFDIPEKIAGLEERYPEISFRMADALGYDERLLDVVRERINSTRMVLSGGRAAGDVAVRAPLSRVAPDGQAGEAAAIATLRPEDIEPCSMEIVRELVEDKVAEEFAFEGAALDIVHRIVHTTGDPSIASDVTVSTEAADSGIAALRRGAPVIVDVTMVRSGLHRERLEQLGCEVLCLIDDDEVAELARTKGKTRAATAMRSLKDRMDGAIVVVGNAPTALCEVLDIIAEGVWPALVIGTPVGFVGAAESKAALVDRAGLVPFVTVRGTRGGSPVAAAVVNALIRHC